MNSALLRDLLDLGDAFEEAHPDRSAQTLSNFLTWSNRRQSNTSDSQSIQELNDPQVTYYADTVPVLQTFVAETITKAYRYLKMYIKTAMDGLAALNFDEFICLCYLAARGSMTKNRFG